MKKTALAKVLSKIGTTAAKKSCRLRITVRLSPGKRAD